MSTSYMNWYIPNYILYQRYVVEYSFNQMKYASNSGFGLFQKYLAKLGSFCNNNFSSNQALEDVWSLYHADNSNTPNSTYCCQIKVYKWTATDYDNITWCCITKNLWSFGKMKIGYYGLLKSIYIDKMWLYKDGR